MRINRQIPQKNYDQFATIRFQVTGEDKKVDWPFYFKRCIGALYPLAG